MEFITAISSLIIIVFIIVPGIVVRKTYFSGFFTHQFYQGTFSDRIITTIFWGVFSQLITLILFKITLNDSTLLGGVDALFNSNENKKFQLNLQKTSMSDVLKILYLFFLSIITPYFIGYIAKIAVRGVGLDIVFNAFKYSNYWHYFLTGDVVRTNNLNELRNIKFKHNGVQRVELDIIADIGSDNTKKYKGTLFNYTLDKTTGQLENIFLTDTEYYNENNEDKKVEGHIFQIPYSKIHNINFRYYPNNISRRAKIANVLNNIFIIISLLFFILTPWIYFPEVSFWRKLISVFMLISLIAQWSGYIDRKYVTIRGVIKVGDEEITKNNSTSKNQPMKFKEILVITIIFLILSILLLGIHHHIRHWLGF